MSDCDIDAEELMYTAKELKKRRFEVVAEIFADGGVKNVRTSQVRDHTGD
jgi:hypothetical protein